ncbi:hypothetical protein B5M09_007288 [Aphanomyces astaci]|uniref:Uncharacterized protein n=1 Tax=Aphanomyces astaci TaxID=112090 RepID=A0A425CYR4_APHAT|nr:hypothetical protein B5M09_007288 [Aphanomyces astaci]
MAHPVDAAPAQPHHFYLEVFLGYGYVLSSLCLSFYYLHLLAPYLANDARLTNFNQSGAQSFLIDAINRELEHPRLDVSIWNITSTSIAKDYSTPNTPLLIPAGYARRALLDDTRIEAVIRRSLQASANTLSRLPTQYCWVDFRDNAAVYLESTLRLANWDGWVAFHGGGFVPAIVSGMTPRENGQLWLGQVAATIVTDADMESAVWRLHNLTRYVLQWQNYQQDGLVEYVAVSNGYVSVVLAGLALILAVYSVMNRWSVIGRNLLRFNRVAGCVWIGRPLLLARGISAILLLSRDTLDL